MWIAARIKWIMLISGALTCTMLYATLAPEAALSTAFGETFEGQLATIVVRNWGALIALVGAMLIYGAYHPEVRSLVLTAACLSKLTFISLMLLHGRQYLGHPVGISMVVDLIMVALFLAYLVHVRHSAATA